MGRRPNPEALNFAAEVLRAYEGSPGHESEELAMLGAVADWLDAQARAGEQRTNEREAARWAAEFGVAPAEWRRMMAAAKATPR